MASAATASADSGSSRLRAFARLALLIGWFFICVVPHLAARLGGRSRWPRRFLAGTARICGADVRVAGGPAATGTLLIANHVSWLDIPVLAGATGCAFVSKAEIADHPLLKWIADQNATLYVDRADKRAIHGQAQRLREALASGHPLAIFPEGTVGDGGQLLPFKPSLLSAVAPPPDGVAMRPVAIDYHGRASELAWIPGEHGLANFLRILGRARRNPVTVRLLDPLEPTDDRKALARAAHDAVAVALAGGETARPVL
ncbi:lysophospholipid acyltransferase family protein [Sphingomonas mesophila]|uniref:lysophospholipid acyltransferase family protein n=1 Tax=Sphingomonas mesophila TaxID=2303576 RepID=UPI000E595B3F|nr:lysophospholipid acyltransferase family protein [Sphingomonas mesophila]